MAQDFDGYNGYDEEDDWSYDYEEDNQSTMDIAKSIMVQLESDDELLRDFNLLLRQKKLRKIKK